MMEDIIMRRLIVVDGRNNDCMLAVSGETANILGKPTYFLIFVGKYAK